MSGTVLKKITVSGSAVVCENQVRGVFFETCNYASASVDSLTSDRPIPVGTCKTVTDKLFSVGESVEILDGSKIDTHLGSIIARTWSPLRASLVGKVFTVTAICDDGDIRIDTTPCYFSPAHLRAVVRRQCKIEELKVGDVVVCSERHEDENLWDSDMNLTVGKEGTVLRIDNSDKTAKVSFPDTRNEWWYKIDWLSFAEKQFKIGDKVICDQSHQYDRSANLSRWCDGDGYPWCDKMNQYVGKVGTVVDVRSTVVTVKFQEGCNGTFCYYRDWLRHVEQPRTSTTSVDENISFRILDAALSAFPQDGISADALAEIVKDRLSKRARKS